MTFWKGSGNSILLVFIIAFISALTANAAMDALRPDDQLQVEGDSLIISHNNEPAKIIKVQIIPKGTFLFHWTTPENQVRWMDQGGIIDSGEIEFLSKPSEEKQAYGPGFYVSLDPLDSANFGSDGVYLKTPKDYLLLDVATNGRLTESESKLNQDLFRKAGIVGNTGSYTWKVIFSPEVTHGLNRLNADAVLDFYELSNQPNPLKHIKDVFEKFGALKPHKYIERNLPVLQRILSKKSVTGLEVSKLLSQLKEGYFGSLAKFVETKIPPSLLQDMSLATSQISTLEVFKLDQVVGGLKASARLNVLAPEIDKMLEGKKLSTEEHAKIWNFLSAPIKAGKATQTPILDLELETETPLLRKLQNEFPDELRDFFSMTPKTFSESKLKQARNLGVLLPDVFPGQRDPGGRLPDQKLVKSAEALQVVNDFGKNFLDSHAFIDQYDLARAAANNLEEPWKLYDEPGKTPLLARWKGAYSAATNKAFVTDTHSALTGSSTDFRGNSVQAGGDIFLPGDKDGYARVTGEQLQNLKDNPYLALRVKEDPWPQHLGIRTYLVRYEYPSASTFSAFQDNLSSSLRKELLYARDKGQLADQAGKEFQAFTRKILKELWKKASSEKTPLARYRARISVHPFNDYNGRLARLYYSVEQKSPLILPSWDNDLFSSPSMLAAERDKGEIALRKITAGLVNQHELSPKFPLYYNSPEIFESILDLPPLRNPTQRNRHTERIRSLLRDQGVSEMIRKKEYNQVRWRLWDEEGKLWQALPKDERISALRKWAMGGHSPEFSDENLFKQVLEESKLLARGDDANRIIHWWIQLASGIEPTYGKTLADFFGSLKSPYDQVFFEELAKSESTLNVPWGGAFRGKLRDILYHAIKRNSGGSEEEKWSKIYLRNVLQDPRDHNRPFDEVFRYLKDDGKSAALASLATDLFKGTDLQMQKKLLNLIPLLPIEHQGVFASNYLRELRTLGDLDEAQRLLIRAIGKPGPISDRAKEWLATKKFSPAFTAKLLLDPEFRRLPGVKLSDGIFALETPAQQLSILQSNFDRKNYSDFLEAARHLELDSKKDGVDRILSYLEKNLPVVARASGREEDKLNAALILAHLKPEASFIEEAAKALSHASGSEAFSRELPFFLEKAEGNVLKDRLNLLLSFTRPNEKEAFQVLGYAPESFTWPKGWRDAVENSIRRIPKEELSRILYSQWEANKEGALLSKTRMIFAQLPEIEQINLIKNRFYKGPVAREVLASNSNELMGALLKSWRLALSPAKTKAAVQYLRQLQKDPATGFLSGPGGEVQLTIANSYIDSAEHPIEMKAAWAKVLKDALGDPLAWNGDLGENLAANLGLLRTVEPNSVEADRIILVAIRSVSEKKLHSLTTQTSSAALTILLKSLPRLESYTSELLETQARTGNLEIMRALIAAKASKVFLKEDEFKLLTQTLSTPGLPKSEYKLAAQEIKYFFGRTKPSDAERITLAKSLENFYRADASRFGKGYEYMKPIFALANLNYEQAAPELQRSNLSVNSDATVSCSMRFQGL